MAFLKGKKPGGITFEGGPGDTMERAVIIRGVSDHALGVEAEYRYLAQAFGRRGRDWEPIGQELLESGAIIINCNTVLSKRSVTINGIKKMVNGFIVNKAKIFY